VEGSQVWSARVVRALGARGDFVDVDYATQAKRWSVSPRTLRRRLAKEGTTLSRLLDEARLHRARNYLQHTPATTVTEIAQVLGYADETSFRRAFKRWTGESPKAYRAHHGGKKHEEKAAWTRDNPVNG